MDLTAEQMECIESDNPMVNQLLLEYDIDFVKHKYMKIYYEKLLQKGLSGNASFKSVIMGHIKALEETSVGSFLSEIEGHQIALSDLLNMSLFKNSTVESLVSAVYDFFPYEIVLPMLMDYNFCSQFFKLIIESQKEKRKIIINRIFGLFKPKYQSQKFVFIIIAEMLFDYFNCFCTGNDLNEKYKSVINDNFDKILFDKDEVEMLRNRCFTPNIFHVKPYAKQPNIVEIKLFDSSKLNNEIVGLKYITLEFRKMACQPSVSMKILFILRVSNILKSELLNIKDLLPGADELFKYYVYLICDSRLSNWYELLNYIDNNCFDFVKSSKFGYNIEQLKSCTKFIEDLCKKINK